ncbi:MAG: recombinase family protein [Cellulosilyticaceae bacterium]
MNAALYIRVSTDDQLEFSPDAQRRALIEYAKKNNMLISEEHIFIDEGITGTSVNKRKAFQKMISMAKKKPKPFDAILVHKFDRFARSREDSVVYKSLLRKDCGIKVISITEQLEDDKFSVILEAMLEAMAEYYSLNLADEVMKGMSEKARKGRIQADAPYGYKLENSEYIVIDDEAKVINLMFEQVANGTGLTCVCRNLLNMGVTAKRGGRWTPKRVKYAIQNPVYIGKLRWNYTTHKNGRKINDPSDWIIVDGSHQSIITNDLFENANKNLIQASSSVTRRPHNTAIKHWASGLLRCSECNTTLVYNEVLRKKGGARSSFRCNHYNKGSCNTANYIRVEKIEVAIKNAFKSHLDQIEKYKLGQMELPITRKNIDKSERELLELQLEKIKNKYKFAKNAYLAEIDTLEEYKETKQLLSKEEQNILDKLSSLKNTTQDIVIIKNNIITALDLLDDESKSIEEKNAFLKSFIERIVVNVTLDTIRVYYYL